MQQSPPRLRQRLLPALLVAWAAAGLALAAGGAWYGIRAIGFFEPDEYPGDHRVCLTPPGKAQSVAYSPDGRLLAAGGETLTEPDLSNSGFVQVWDAGSGAEVATLRGISARANGVAFSPDGKLLAAATGGPPTYETTPRKQRKKSRAEVRVWEVGTWREVATLKGHARAVNSVAFSPDGKTLASVGGAGNDACEVRLWEVGSWGHAVLGGFAGRPNAVAFRPGGGVLAVASTLPEWEDEEGGEITLWDVNTRTLTGRWRTESENFAAIAFSADGRALASVTLYAGEAELWDVATRKRKAKLIGPDDRLGPRLAGSPREPLIVTQGWKGLDLWDAATGERKGMLRNEKRGDTNWDSVYAIAVSPDGRTVATASEFGVKLWALP